MVSGFRYRVASVGGAVLVTVGAVVVANHPAVQDLLTTAVPVLDRLPATVLTNGDLTLALLTTLPVVFVSLLPLFKPRPRRILDTIFVTERRVVVAVLALATVGYFDYTYRLPRSTLILTAVVLLVALPFWFVAIRRPPARAERVVVVGDDPEEMEAVLDAIDVPVLGYVSPPSPYYAGAFPGESPARSDGGGELRAASAEGPLDDLRLLGGLSRLDDILVEYDVDTAVLAFSTTNRAEFFGTLGACYEHGVTAKVHREHTDHVLTAATSGSGELVEVDLEPWDWQDHLLKRAFDVAFSLGGLVVLSPVMVAIAAAVTLDSPGPVLYSQERTAEFGETFTVYKFRSMVQDAESETGVKLSEEDAGGVDPRVTRVGRVLRRTHLDEIPQLWSVLVGDMSVVGPRPERPELDSDIEGEVVQWRQRWFVKPGLTGLAQVEDVTGFEPEAKLRMDVEYIRKQSFWFDVKIVIRQVWTVACHLSEFLFSE